jgi:hypothetical protein
MTDFRRPPSAGDLDHEQGSTLLSDNRPKPATDIPFCGCLSVQYYQPYFDVDTVDVTSRISSSLLYCRAEQNFLTTIRERPDAYGPFWVSTAAPCVTFGLQQLTSRDVFFPFADIYNACVFARRCVTFERLVVVVDEGRAMVGALSDPPMTSSFVPTYVVAASPGNTTSNRC